MEASTQAAQTPVIGRIVRYTGGTEPGVTPREFAGVIDTTYAEDNTLSGPLSVCLTVFDPGGAYQLRDVPFAQEGTAPALWHWPQIESTETPGDSPSGPGPDPVPEPEGGVPCYSRENMPEGFDENADEFRKTTTIKAVKIAGPFAVQVDGDPGNTISIEDGYLALDSRGYPYPIATAEFEGIYAEVGSKNEIKVLLAQLRPAIAEDDADTDALVAALDEYLK